MNNVEQIKSPHSTLSLELATRLVDGWEMPETNKACITMLKKITLDLASQMVKLNHPLAEEGTVHRDYQDINALILERIKYLNTFSIVITLTDLDSDKSRMDGTGKMYVENMLDKIVKLLEHTENSGGLTLLDKDVWSIYICLGRLNKDLQKKQSLLMGKHIHQKLKALTAK